MKGPKKRVLVVDDKKYWRNLLTDLLKDEFEVKSTADFVTAIAVIEAQIPPFHVVVTDLRLVDDEHDNVDGIEIVKRVNQMGEYTSTIVVTEYPSIESAYKGGLLKVKAYIQKSSFTNEEYVEAVRKAAEDAECVRCAFVIMPFAKEFDDIWEEIFEITEKIGLASCRAIDPSQSRVILREIVDRIRGAGLVISDLSGRNLNVLFETGIADAMHKCVILLIEKNQKTSQFLDVQRYLTYEKNFPGAKKMRGDLSRAIQAAMAQNYPPVFERNAAAIDPNLCLILIRKNNLGQDTFDTIIKPVVSAEGFTSENCLSTHKDGIWIDKIWEQLNRAQVVIADLSGSDLDVFYLAGLAFGLGKKLILLSDTRSIIPFDLKAKYTVTYSRTTEDKREQARIELKAIIDQLLPMRRIPSKPDACILTVLREEYDAVCKQLTNLQDPPGLNQSPNTYAWKLGDVWSSKHNKPYRVIIGMAGRPGQNEAALAAAQAIHLWQPNYMFFCGIAGGLAAPKKQDVQLGDVVIADTIYGYEYAKLEHGFLLRDNWTYQTDGGLLTGMSAYSNQTAWEERLRSIPPRPCKPNILIAEVASGDKVVDNPDNVFFAEVLKRHPKVKAVEMEGAGVGSAIRQAQSLKIQTGFIMVRGISDLPRPPVENAEEERGTEERDNWKPFAAHCAAAFIVGYIADGLPFPPQ